MVETFWTGENRFLSVWRSVLDHFFFLSLSLSHRDDTPAFVQTKFHSMA